MNVILKCFWSVVSTAVFGPYWRRANPRCHVTCQYGPLDQRSDIMCSTNVKYIVFELLVYLKLCDHRTFGSFTRLAIIESS